MDQVARLQNLLETVQANRARPRPGRPANRAATAPVATAAPVVEPEFDVDIEPEPAFAEEAPVASMPTPIPEAPEPAPPAVAAPGAPKRPERSPLQRAFDNEINPPVPEAPRPGAPQPAQNPVGPVSVPAQRSANDGPEEIPLTPPAASARPIAQTVSPVPSIKDASFGELLRRSLSLRPL